MPLFLCGESAEHHGKGLDSSLNPLLCLKAGSTRPNIFLLDTHLIFMIAWFSFTLLSLPLKSPSQQPAEISSLLAQSSGPREKSSSVWLSHRATSRVQNWDYPFISKGIKAWCQTHGLQQSRQGGPWWGCRMEGGLWASSVPWQERPAASRGVPGRALPAGWGWGRCSFPSAEHWWDLSELLGAQCKRDLDTVELVQWRATRISKGLKQVTYKASAWKWNLIHVHNFIYSINTWGRGCKEDGAGLCFTVPTGRTRGNGNKLKHRKFH